MEGGVRRINLPVQKDAAEALIEVLTQSGDGLLKHIKRGGALGTVGTLVLEIVVENLIDRVRVWKGNQLLVLGDILPVIDEQGLDVIRDWKLDGGATVKVVLLSIVSFVMKGRKIVKSRKGSRRAVNKQPRVSK